ncbi:MAG TPA: F0F1 ATP synthase subunit epsilon [Steroidobacteraceae bacterium]|nr:F0F1 ATP synthase subunit epsilon [Steroidobacteraceae bacterium]
MRLTVATPLAIALETEGVMHVRGEDATGAFGILPGHADFVTVLATCVVSWRDQRGNDHHIAVRGGVLKVQQGRSVAIDTREAVLGDDLQQLESDVLVVFRSRVAEEQVARADERRLYLAAVEQIIRYLRPNGRPGVGGPVGDEIHGASNP